MIRVLDACCGSKMFWFDKKHPDVVYMDNRQLDDVLCDGRTLNVNPDIIADFRKIPFADETFYLVVFDPPHLVRAGETSWLAKKYGKLNEDTWKEDIRKGFNECMRVLRKNGTLIFKWNEEQIKTSEVIQAIGQMPLFGNRRAKTHWLVFYERGGLMAINKGLFSSNTDLWETPQEIFNLLDIGGCGCFVEF